MQFVRRSAFLLAALAVPAWAQTAALDLKLPADTAPPPAAAVANESAAATARAASPPALPSMTDANGAGPHARTACDDSTYGKPQVHGSIGMGVVAGNRLSGDYETGSVQVSKALGSCEDPKGFVSVSIDVGQGNIDRQHRHGRRHPGAPN
jgi:hypothetical protein